MAGLLGMPLNLDQTRAEVEAGKLELLGARSSVSFHSAKASSTLPGIVTTISNKMDSRPVRLQ